MLTPENFRVGVLRLGNILYCDLYHGFSMSLPKKCDHHVLVSSVVLHGDALEQLFQNSYLSYFDDNSVTCLSVLKELITRNLRASKMRRQNVISILRSLSGVQEQPSSGRFKYSECISLA